MKKLVIISLIFSLITIGILFWSNVIEVTSKNWGVLPFLYFSLSLGYWWFIGMFGILTGLFDPIPEENNNKKPKKSESRSYPTFYPSDSKGEKKNDDSGSFVASAAVGYITDNPLIGGSVGGSFSGGLFGSSLN
jgi:hypothetical protein